MNETQDDGSMDKLKPYLVNQLEQELGFDKQLVNRINRRMKKDNNRHHKLILYSRGYDGAESRKLQMRR